MAQPTKQIDLTKTIHDFSDTTTPELIRMTSCSFSKEARLALVHRAYTGDPDAMQAINSFSHNLLHDYIRALQGVIYSALWDVRCSNPDRAKATLKNALIAPKAPLKLTPKSKPDDGDSSQ